MKACSHRFSRCFSPHKLFAPREFELPAVLSMPNRPSLALEIGAGRGKHACIYASQHRERHLIAIERTRSKAQDLLRRAKNHSNLSAIHADAIAWSVHALPPACLSEVMILYPNPEPNNSNQRWVNMPFFEFLLSRMQAQATLTLASNVLNYLDEAEEKLHHIWRLPTVRQKIAPNSARTHFEIKYLARGELCQELIVTKPKKYYTRFDCYRHEGGVS